MKNNNLIQQVIYLFIYSFMYLFTIRLTTLPVRHVLKLRKFYK